MAKQFQAFTTEKTGRPHFSLTLILSTTAVFALLVADGVRLAPIGMATAVELTKVAVLLCALALVKRSMHPKSTTAIVPVENETGSTTLHEETATSDSSSKTELIASKEAPPNAASMSADTTSGAEHIHEGSTVPEVTPESRPHHVRLVPKKATSAHNKEECAKRSSKITVKKRSPTPNPRTGGIPPERMSIVTQSVLGPAPQQTAPFYVEKTALVTGHRCETRAKKSSQSAQETKEVAGCESASRAKGTSGSAPFKPVEKVLPESRGKTPEVIKDAGSPNEVCEIDTDGEARGTGCSTHVVESKARTNVSVKCRRSESEKKRGRERKERNACVERYRHPVFFRVFHYK